MGSQQQFCLRWNNHQNNLLSVFDQLLQNESFVDVTLACDGLSLKAHKVVLSACSPYFQKLLLDNPCQHPIVILNNVQYADLKALVDFMYKGEVSVFQDQLSALLRTAEALKIKGLSEVAPAHPDSGATTGTKESAMMSSASGAITTSVTTVLNAPSDPSAAPPPPCMGKRKRSRPHRMSGAGNDSESDEMDAASPESVESKVNIHEDSSVANVGDGHSRRAPLATAARSSMPPPCASDGAIASDSRHAEHNCQPEPRIHEGFSQENEEAHNSSLDSNSFLGIPSFSTVTSHQYHHAMSLPCTTQASSHMPQDAAVEICNKTGATTAAEYHGIITPTTESSAVVAAPETNGSNANSGGDACGGRGLSSLGAQLKDCADEADVRASQWSTGGDLTHSLDALRSGRFTLSRTPSVCGIQNAALWQRAKREGLDFTKRECMSAATSWTEDHLVQALEAIRSGRMSITRAAVTFGIPNSTLWQRSRREGIDTSRNGPFAHQSSWTESNLAQALDAVRSGRMSVNKASATFGIPSTTLWSRAKRYGIETSRRGGAYEHDRDEVMWHALQAVKAGAISMTQASIKYNVPYTTLWKHFKKWEMIGGPLTLPLSMATSHVQPQPSVPSSVGMVMHHVGTGSLHSHPIDSIVVEQTSSSSSIAT